MYNPTVVGVDPGLVHTGVVVFDFETSSRQLTLGHDVIDGLDAQAVRVSVEKLTQPHDFNTLDIFIEQYRQRSGFAVDERMLQANDTFRRALNGRLQRNHGVKKIVTPELMALLDAWSWPTTHHQDLRSAARIALLGMMLDTTLNSVLFGYVRDSLDGRKWNVRTNN